MLILIDTNVLLRIAEVGHANSQLATDAVEKLRVQSHKLVIVPQTIYEFWNVASRSMAANGLANLLLKRNC